MDTGRGGSTAREGPRGARGVGATQASSTTQPMDHRSMTAACSKGHAHRTASCRPQPRKDAEGLNLPLQSCRKRHSRRSSPISIAIESVSASNSRRWRPKSHPCNTSGDPTLALGNNVPRSAKSMLKFVDRFGGSLGKSQRFHRIFLIGNSFN